MKMAESVVLLAIVIGVRMAYQAIVLRMAMTRDKARNREIAALLRAARPGATVVIICSRREESAR